MIKIKSWFTEWHEVDFDTALHFYCVLSDITRRRFFNTHFQGVTRGELENARKCN